MPEDASLDDFLDAGEDGEAAGGDDEHDDGAGEADDDAEAVDPAAVEGATATHAWSPDGAACAACGTTVERRWRDESGLVCAECKEW